MSSGNWQIDKQLLQLGIGKSATSRVLSYVEMWEARCYSSGIPDQLPTKLEASLRAPSWRRIAQCILKNDMKLRGLGYTEAHYNADYVKMFESKGSDQMSFSFGGIAQ